MGREDNIQIKSETVDVSHSNNSNNGIEVMEVVRHTEDTTVTISTPAQRTETNPSALSVTVAASGGGKKRLRTSVVLEEMDKKFLLEQYVSERQKNVNLHLQNRVSQLERELRDKERKMQDAEKIHIETLSLAESHHRGNVLNEIGRLMDSEFNCSICNEPAVLNCGHTFCTYCINRALQTDYLCPVCRTGYNFNPPAKNIEMRNFINKLFQMLPEDTKTTRDQIVQERAALPAPTTNNQNRNQRGTRRGRRSTSASPINFLDFLHAGERLAYRVPGTDRSRSRSVSISLSDSESDGDSSNISLLDAMEANNTDNSQPARQTPSPPLRFNMWGSSNNSEPRPFNRFDFLTRAVPLPWTGIGRARERGQSRGTETRRPDQPTTGQTARRGRPFTPRHSVYVGGPTRRWGPRRQNGVRENENNNSATSSTAPRNRPVTGSNISFRHRSPGRFGVALRHLGRPTPTTSFREAVNAVASSPPARIRLPTPRYARRPLPLENFEEWFSRREDVPVVASLASHSEPLQHDHSYTSALANTSSNVSNSQANNNNGNNEHENHLSQALAMLATTTCTTGESLFSEQENAQNSSSRAVASNLNTEPRRSPRIAGQFRHRFLEEENGRNSDQNQEGGLSSVRNNDSQQEMQSRTSSISTTGGIRGSNSTPSLDSPPSSEINASTGTPAPYAERLHALRRFVNDLHNYGSPGSSNRTARRTGGAAEISSNSRNRSRRRNSSDLGFSFDSWERDDSDHHEHLL